MSQWRCYAAWTLSPALAVLAFKLPGAGVPGLGTWHRDDWRPASVERYVGAEGKALIDEQPLEAPTISDVTGDAMGIAERWRAWNPVYEWELHQAPPLWLVVKDGKAVLVDSEPDKDVQAIPVQPPDYYVAHQLLRFPLL